MNYENRKTKQHIKPKWFKNLITLAISFAMVVGIFGGMQMDVCAASHSIHYGEDAFDAQIDVLKWTTFKSGDCLTVWNSQNLDGITNWSIKYQRGETYPEKMLNLGQEFDFSILGNDSEWKFDHWTKEGAYLQLWFKLVSSSNPNPSVSPSQSDSGATSSQTSSVPASTPPHTRM